jgi:hypothetical protein
MRFDDRVPLVLGFAVFLALLFAFAFGFGVATGEGGGGRASVRRYMRLSSRT